MDAKGTLGDRARLDKIDRLRELGISDIVSLPQLVVVGDQSAGKSSVLESLTGFHFPRSVTLCTRHATEIISRREDIESITISIVPHDADVERKKSVQEFRRETSDLNSDEFSKIFQDAAKVMGIKSSDDDTKGGSAFSRDVLRVEMSGPEKDHLTVIDVPGMFENETPGLTTKSDIELVKNMVKGYIGEPRTIILAVVPCNGDIANQKILTFAAEVDGEGKRTLGVLTKPDLAVENATKEVVVDLVNGKRRDLSLGYCVVKNRGADDLTSSLKQARDIEQAFFAQAPWTKLPADKLGVAALRLRLQQLLMDRTKSEFPRVRKDISTKLKRNRQIVESLGEPRNTTEQQRIFVGKIASRFMQLKNYGLDAYYNRDKVFTDNQDLKLITRIRELNELFSDVLHEKGHTRDFALPNSDNEQAGVGEDVAESSSECLSFAEGRGDLYDGKLSFDIPSLGKDELHDVLTEPYQCCPPLSEDIMKHIENEYLNSRGYEIGTFGGEMLPTTFKEQSKKWRPLTLGHVSNVILVVHHFLHSILKESCPDSNIHAELWAFFQEDLEKRYQRAMNHANFLLDVEFEGKSITYNPAFEQTLYQNKIERNQRLSDGTKSEEPAMVINPKNIWAFLQDIFHRNSSLEATSHDIHDVLHTFYGIARSRFTDVVCQQAVDHYLLHAVDSPLNVLSDQVVLSATAEQLEAIAGEDMATRGKRERLTREIGDLSKALDILRG